MESWKVYAFRPFLLERKKERMKQYIDKINHMLTVGNITEEVERRLDVLTNSFTCVLSGGATNAFRIHVRKLRKIFDTAYVQAYGFPSVVDVLVEEGYTVVPVDSEENNLIMSVDDLKKATAEYKKKGIVVITPYYGFWDREKLREIEDRIQDERILYDYEILLDGAHTLGVFDGGYKSVISVGSTKLCGCANGGVFVSCWKNDVEYAKFVRNGSLVGFREFLGNAERHYLGEFECAFLLASLDYLEGEIKLREQIYKQYRDLLFDGVEIPKYGNKWNYIYVPLRFREPIRAKVGSELRRMGIEELMLQTTPIHGIYSYKGERRKTPNAEKHSLTHIVLPMYEGVDTAYVMDVIRKVIKR
jgi:dTDP-4-amino-4,6-dideoxygalactose transaminase